MRKQLRLKAKFSGVGVGLKGLGNLGKRKSVKFETLKVRFFYFLFFLFHKGDLSTPLEKAQVKIGNL